MTYAEIKTLASEEAYEMLRKPFVKYPDTEAGYWKAVNDHRALMDFELGVDEHPTIQKLLVDRRWDMAQYYEDLHGWDVKC